MTEPTISQEEPTTALHKWEADIAWFNDKIEFRRVLVFVTVTILVALLSVMAMVMSVIVVGLNSNPIQTMYPPMYIFGVLGFILAPVAGVTVWNILRFFDLISTRTATCLTKPPLPESK